MVSQFPTRELDVPATKEFVRAEIAEFEVRLDGKLTGMTRWMVGTVIGVGAAVIAAVGLFG